LSDGTAPMCNADLYFCITAKTQLQVIPWAGR
jgi:hypothetical protein